MNKLSLKFVAFLFLLQTGCSGPLATLLELARNEKLKEKAYRQETQNFFLLKKYIQENFPKPSFKYTQGGGECWVYKPAPLDANQRIYLFFDQNNCLIKWEEKYLSKKAN